VTEIAQDALRIRIAGALETPLATALAGYAKLAEGLDEPDRNDPRGNAARHVACRAALQHVVTLLRLADLAVAKPATSEGDEAARLLAEARRALAGDGGGPT
jgi:hypothetical protein